MSHYKFKNRDCESGEEPKASMLNNPLRIQQLPTGSIIDFYLPVEIGYDPADYIDFFRAARDAKNVDQIVVHINCYGGEVSTAYNIIDVLNSSEAQVKICVEGNCCSAATMVMLCGDSWEIAEHAYVMIHAWSSLRYGKWNEQQASYQFDKTWLEKSFRETYKDFLTPEEIEEVIAGKDLYFDSNETKARLEKFKEKDFKRQEIIDAIAEKYQNAINAEISQTLADFEKEDKKDNKKEAAKKSSKSPAKRGAKK